jgi:hypothetical protein
MFPASALLYFASIKGSPKLTQKGKLGINKNALNTEKYNQ